METHSVSAGNSIAGTCIPANLRRKKCENTKIPRAEVFPVLLFIIGLLSCFLQILFLFICHLSTSFYQERVNIQFFTVKPIRCKISKTYLVQNSQGFLITQKLDKLVCNILPLPEILSNALWSSREIEMKHTCRLSLYLELLFGPLEMKVTV